MTANLHAIWLDDLAPGEGSTPIWDALYAEQDAETQRIVFNACADEHTEPVAVERTLSGLIQEDFADVEEWFDSGDAPLPEPDVIDTAVIVAWEKPKPKKKPTPRKPAAKKATQRKKPGVLADAEAKLAGVAARVKAQTDEMGGAS